MDDNCDKEIRKIRKKLRQIERLHEKPDDLTPEECMKIRSQQELRAQLQALLATSTKRSASQALQVGGGGKTASSAAATTTGSSLHSTGCEYGDAGDDNIANSSYSDLDSSAVTLDSSANFDDSGYSPLLSPREVATAPPSETLEAYRPEDEQQHEEQEVEEPWVAVGGQKMASSPVTPATHTAKHEDSASAHEPSVAASSDTPTIQVLPSTPAREPTKAVTKETSGKSSGRHDILTTKKPNMSRSAAPVLSEREKQKMEREQFQASLKTERLGWEASRLEAITLGESVEGGLGVTCVDCAGDLVVTGSRDTTVRSWSVASRSELHSLTGHTDTITCIKILPANCALPQADDGAANSSDRHVISGSRDCTVRVWNISRAKQCKSLYTYAPVLCLAWTDKVMATGADSGRVQLWSWPSLSEVCSLRVHEEAITCVQLQGRLLVTGDSPGMIKLWEVSPTYTSAKPLPVMSSVRGSPLRPDQQPDHTAADSGTVGSGYRPVQSLCMPSNQYLVWGDDGVNLKMYVLKNSSLVKFPNHLGSFGRTDCLALSSDGNMLLSAAYDLDTGESYVNVRSVKTMQYITTLHATDTTRCAMQHVRAMACTIQPLQAGSAGAGSSRHRWCLAGDTLTVFDVRPAPAPTQTPSKKSKKQALARTDECEYRFVFVPDLAGKATDSDIESSDDEDGTDAIGSSGGASDTGNEGDTENEGAPMTATGGGARRRRRKRASSAVPASGIPGTVTDTWWFMKWCTIL